MNISKSDIEILESTINLINQVKDNNWLWSDIQKNLELSKQGLDIVLKNLFESLEVKN